MEERKYKLLVSCVQKITTENGDLVVLVPKMNSFLNRPVSVANFGLRGTTPSCVSMADRHRHDGVSLGKRHTRVRQSLKFMNIFLLKVCTVYVVLEPNSTQVLQ